MTFKIIQQDNFEKVILQKRDCQRLGNKNQTYFETKKTESVKTGQEFRYPLHFVVRSVANVARVYRFLSNARHFSSHGQRLRQYHLKRVVSFSIENNTIQ